MGIGPITGRGVGLIIPRIGHTVAVRIYGWNGVWRWCDIPHLHQWVSILRSRAAAYVVWLIPNTITVRIRAGVVVAPVISARRVAVVPDVRTSVIPGIVVDIVDEIIMKNGVIRQRI